MADHKPTNPDEEAIQPSASPHHTDEPDLHHATLFSTDPVFEYHKRRKSIPKTREVPESDGKVEIVAPEQHEELQVVDEPIPEAPVITADSSTDAERQDARYSPFVQWLQSKPVATVERKKLSVDAPAGPEGSDGTKKMKPKKKKKKSKKDPAGKKLRKKATRSRQDLGTDIFSETLADILATQGHTKKAIQMYERLSLIYPEKSRLFAAKIEELKKIE